jgi:methylated-DNA-[protein]-cysteine S-methyltransferase
VNYDAILPAPFGALGVRLDGDCLIGLEFLPPGTPHSTSPQSTAIDTISAELDAYYADAKHHFKLNYVASGSPFRQKVWHHLLSIAAGQTRSYGDVARELNSSARAVGQAVGDNPVPILIPCHRVIAAQGKLGGFMHHRSGFSQDIKRWLLAHENAY